MRCFFDTNVLVYMFDADDPTKMAIARQLYSQSVQERSALLSIQVLQEFFVTVTHKLGTPLSHDEAVRAIRDFADLSIVRPDTDLILEAIAASRHFRISFWDSLIVQAALRGAATILYTEDLQHGQTFETLTVQNPFDGSRH
jgi:predicted nucleic acid-binding protein